MPEEILFFIIRLAILACIAGLIWIALSQILVPWLNGKPLFPLIKSGRGNLLSDIREYERNQLLEELEDKRRQVELAQIENQLQEVRNKIDEEKRKSVGDKK